MKKTKIQNNSGLTLCIAVSETCDSFSSVAEAVYAKIQNAIDNDSAALYNGNDEKVEVPILTPIRNLFPKTHNPESPQFEGLFNGWEKACHLLMVDASKCATDIFISLIVEHFSEDLATIWAAALKEAQKDKDFPVFLGEDCAAVHVDLTDGSWFEFIIENCSAQDEDEDN